METHNQTRRGKPLRIAITSFASSLLLAPIFAYRYLLSPWVGHNCRFHPTCSHYAEQAIKTMGPLKGSWMALRRLGKCHPWHQGGYDPLPNDLDNDKTVNK